MTIRCFLALALAAGLAACDAADVSTRASNEQAPTREAASDPTPAPAGNAMASAPALAGEYRIAGVDGADIDLPYGITASITGDRIHVVADCVNVAWSYRLEGDRIATERVPVEGCARGLNRVEEALVAAFDAAGRVERTASNGIEFSGGGRSVLLFSQ